MDTWPMETALEGHCDGLRRVLTCLLTGTEKREHDVHNLRVLLWSILAHEGTQLLSRYEHYLRGLARVLKKPLRPLSARYDAHAMHYDDEVLFATALCPELLWICHDQLNVLA